ncbi:MAG: hypothetical protein M1831_004258 [Alyxoria varia]|nr:MAG: hypothetical protein M1831_004258 [Alyxoria varia]
MAITTSESLERLQGLKNDLSLLNDTTVPNVERLSAELESRVDEFRKVFDKNPRNEKSRQALNSGILKLDDQEFSVNDDFKLQAAQVAEALDVDELDAAALCIDAQQSIESLDRSPLAASVYLYHDRREYVLECLRLCLEKVVLGQEEGEDLPRYIPCTSFLDQVMSSGGKAPNPTSQYWEKCINAMMEAENSQQHVIQRLHTISMTGQRQSEELATLMNFQLASLKRQHDLLGSVAFWLAKYKEVDFVGLRHITTHLKQIDRYDATVSHYLPVLYYLLYSLGRGGSKRSADPHRQLKDSQDFHIMISSTKENDAWYLRQLQASVVACWVVAYAGLFVDQPDAASMLGVDASAEVKSYDALLKTAIKDGALHLLLATAQNTADNNWVDPARRGVVSFLLQDAPALHSDNFNASRSFKTILMEQLQAFAEHWVSNMPDTLRTLKFDEDEQRRNLQSRAQIRGSEYEYNIERFLLVITYAYEGDMDASSNFWSDQESFLFGFVEWAAQRQSTPRIAAFCEMLTAISEGQENADAAHNFLLKSVADDGASASLKTRRRSPLSWTHILRELEYYATTFRGKSSGTGSISYNSRSQPDQLVEAESATMVESYLRLLSHLCKQSPLTRGWLLNHPTFRIHEQLLSLCRPDVVGRLRACAFTAFASLLNHKGLEVNNGLWNALDEWLHGHTPFTPNIPESPVKNSPPTAPERKILDFISNGFEEPVSFVIVLIQLVMPMEDEITLYDTLPFPEDLGREYRMPGIDLYVDWVVGDIFARKPTGMQDVQQVRIMRLNCLRFIRSCLSSFNEGLISFAHISNISVDVAIQTSSVSTYLRLHPFGRTMEWMFNDKVLAALFSTACQDPTEIGAADWDSPLVLGVLESIETISLVLSKQATFHDVVRPELKKKTVQGGASVGNAALASFEDAILNNLDLITRLAFYCGSGHEQLATKSLHLLEKLSASRKLAAPVISSGRRRSENSRLITQLKKDSACESIARSFAFEMQFDERSLEQGPGSPGLMIKSQILGFLRSSLTAILDQPTAAHVLLGFTCSYNSIQPPEDGSFGGSLLHAVIQFLIECPEGETEMLMSWLLSVRALTWGVLCILWRSPLSAQFILPELRNEDLFLHQSARQFPLRPDTLWDGKMYSDSDFYLSPAADGCANALRQRKFYTEYAATELRHAKAAGLSTLTSSIQSTLLGLMTLPDGQQVDVMSIFDQLDFLDLHVDEPFLFPDTKFFEPSLFDLCQRQSEDGLVVSDMDKVQQVVTLKKNEILRVGILQSTTDQEQMEAEAEDICSCLQANNQKSAILSAKADNLKAWTRLATIMLQCCDWEPAQRNTFVMQLLQLMLPRIERSFSQGVKWASLLLQFGKILMRQVQFSSPGSGSELDIADDKIFQLFRIVLTGMQTPEADASVRETCSYICYLYLRGICSSDDAKSLRRSALQFIDSMGGRLMGILCDDAYSGEGQCRISALLLLGTFVSLSNLEESKSVINQFNMYNFIQIMVENLASIPVEIQNASGSAVTLVLSYHNASLALLLKLAQSRLGAAQVQNSGFFASVRDCRIFDADPDIGLDADNPQALSTYFDLMLSIVRIVNAMVLSRGPESDLTISQARQFVNEYRPTIASVYKRNAKIGNASEDNEAILGRLVDNFTVLMSFSGVLDMDDDRSVNGKSPRMFT